MKRHVPAPQRSFPRPAWLAGLALLIPVAGARAANIALSGFNRDVVSENDGTPSGLRFDGFGFNFPEAGLTDRSGRVASPGLPASRTFLSATGSGVSYALRPYDADNVLRMGDANPASGTLDVVDGAYRLIHVLASSGTFNAQPVPGAQVSDVTLNFADGAVTLPNALRAFDWANGPSSVALGKLDRNFVGDSPSNVSIQDPGSGVGPNAFALYESRLDLASAGLSNRVLQGITFRNAATASGDAGGATSVFAVDGTPVPEPAAAGALAALAAAGLLARRRRPR